MIWSYIHVRKLPHSWVRASNTPASSAPRCPGGKQPGFPFRDNKVYNASHPPQEKRNEEKREKKEAMPMTSYSGTF